MFAAITRASTSRPRAAAGQAFLALYSTVTGLARTNWRTSGKTPQSLITTEEDSADTDSSSTPSDSPHAVSHRRAPSKPPTPHQYKAHKLAMKERFPEGWSPPRRLSRAAMEGLRWLHAQDPETCTTPMLAQKFRISPEAVRRILKSKWEPSKEERERLLQKERVRRDEWIAKKREEENQTQTQLLMEREQGRKGLRTLA
ncbi:hypothetical protein BXZ70DRAFT_999954 [Cristinia sonorae]|uniref:Required for respiratory growth protein 9, mitochondrial n=1 Tax=Cristinia sonorae TaxID=1940300 RepID=A0A8K0URM0_9AGAR|nr:hypothetical protein BXZ70DRAFT_999954 [Cristinia sonorae]